MALSRLTRPRHRGLGRSDDWFYPLEGRMRRLFDDLWSSPLPEMERWTGSYLPPVNIREDDGHVIAEAELPGLSEKEIDLTVTHDTLRISGEKKRHEETKEENYYCLESSYGSFDRVVDLPVEVDENKAEAEFQKGVLTVTMPKSREAKAKTKKVHIKTE